MLNLGSANSGFTLFNKGGMLLSPISEEEVSGYITAYEEMNIDNPDEVKVLFDRLYARCETIYNRIQAAGFDTKPISKVKVSYQ
jgi:hypothetical protein